MKWIDLILKITNPRTSRKGRIRGWGRHVKAKIGSSTVKEKLEEMLYQDKSLRTMDKISEEAVWASEDVRKGGGRRRRGVKGKGEEEVVKFTTPSSATIGISW